MRPTSINNVLLCVILTAATILLMQILNEETVEGESKSKIKHLFPKILSNNETDPWKQELFSRLDRVREVCGELCNISNAEDYESKSKKGADGKTSFVAHVDCDKIMGSEDIDAGDITVPKKIPEELYKYYSLDGLIRLSYGQYWNNVYLGDKAYKGNNVWSEEFISEQIKLAANDALTGTYGLGVTGNLKNMLQKNFDLNGKSILVIGSEKPWVEVLCLSLGAANVTTLEYGEIISEHPQITTYTPEKFRAKYKEKTLDFFDGVVTASSLEHSGLGRYGDALNPWGDILAVARAWCVTKSNGFLVLDVPGGYDQVRWNANRFYGPVRWPLVTTNWMLHPSDSGVFTRNDRHDTHMFTKVEP